MNEKYIVLNTILDCLASRFLLPRSNQLDDALYAYYTTANGFPDSGTLRLDEPDYTNIEGGLGVFALSSTIVVTADTLGNLIANP
ncbi:MAG: hypothetical protein AAB344_05010 [Bacteroidota bacterium]